MRSLFLLLGVPAILSAQAPGRDTTRLGRIVVTAERVPVPLARVTASVTVLDGAALRAAGLTHVLDAVRQVPGVAVARAGSFGAQTSLFTRGGESDYTRVLIDGVQVNDPGGAIDLGALTLDDVERIEVVRGPASVVHGSEAMSGVVQVITRRGSAQPRGWLAAGGGSYGARLVDGGASGTAAGLGWNASLTDHRSDGILAFNNDYANRVASARVTGGGMMPFSVGVRHSDNAFAYPTDGAGRLVDRNARREDQRTQVSAEGQRAMGGRTLVRASAGWLEANGRTDDAPDGPSDTTGFHTYRSRGRVGRTQAALSADVTLRPGHHAVAGVELQDERQRLSDSSNFARTRSRFAETRLTRALFAQALGEVARVAYSVGVRHDDNSAFGGFTTGRAQLAWQVGAGVRLRGGYGTAFKAPTFFEQFSTAFSVGNPELVPERNRGWEAAIEQRAGRAEWSATWFDQRFRDLIQYTFRTPADPNYFNVAAASARGLELEGQVRVGPGATLRAGSTWLRTRVDNPGFDRGQGATFVQGNRLLRRPSATYTLGATLRPAPRLSLDVTGLRVGERDDRDFANFPARPLVLPAYTRVDVGGQLRLTPSTVPTAVSLQLRADNVFGARYQEVANFVAPRRNLFVGLRAEFGR